MALSTSLRLTICMQVFSPAISESCILLSDQTASQKRKAVGIYQSSMSYSDIGTHNRVTRL